MVEAEQVITKIPAEVDSKEPDVKIPSIRPAP